MRHTKRREFLIQAGWLGTGAMLGSSFAMKKHQPRISFSTLGCPDWSLRQAIDFAALHGYAGIEVRGIGKEMDLTTCEAFSTATARATTLQWMAEKKMSFSDLGSSCNLHISDPVERQKNLDEGRRYIDLAAQIGCPNIRVFPNNLPKEQDKDKTMTLMGEGLKELADYARGSNVHVLMETHGDLVHTADIEAVMKQADHPQAGLVWDIVNMWIETNESPAEAYRRLKPWIRHTHIKDARKRDGKIEYLFLGQGETPIFTAIDLLANGGYEGFYSFEWEKRWHPEIAEPELAFADYAAKMKEHFR
jgi:sugar phosphate isomerase/epimerase